MKKPRLKANKELSALKDSFNIGYQKGYADGYNTALGTPPVQKGGTADQKELEEREDNRND